MYEGRTLYGTKIARSDAVSTSGDLTKDVAIFKRALPVSNIRFVSFLKGLERFDFFSSH